MRDDTVSAVLSGRELAVRADYAAAVPECRWNEVAR
jgi:hypothetical protein